MLVSGEKDVSWNLFFGSFLGVVAITFVVSMKGAFVAFKSSFFQYNCCNKPPHLQVEYQCQSCTYHVYIPVTLTLRSFPSSALRIPTVHNFTRD